MVKIQDNQGPRQGVATTRDVIEINPAAKRHYEREIKILREAPRDPYELGEIVKAKQDEYEKATDSEDIERLLPEIEMLKFVLFLVCRSIRKEQ
jgi:hypothetical protein